MHMYLLSISFTNYMLTHFVQVLTQKTLFLSLCPNSSYYRRKLEISQKAAEEEERYRREIEQ